MSPATTATGHIRQRHTLGLDVFLAFASTSVTPLPLLLCLSLDGHRKWQLVVANGTQEVLHGPTNSHSTANPGDGITYRVSLCHLITMVFPPSMSTCIFFDLIFTPHVEMKMRGKKMHEGKLWVQEKLITPEFFLPSPGCIWQLANFVPSLIACLPTQVLHNIHTDPWHLIFISPVSLCLLSN